MAEKTEGRVWRLEKYDECEGFRIKGRGLVINVPPSVVEQMPDVAIGDMASWEGGWHRVIGIERGGGCKGIGLVLVSAEPALGSNESPPEDWESPVLNKIFPELRAVRDALASVRATMAFDVRDWSRDSNDAWLYGILVGYEEALDEVAAQHKWKDEDVARLRTFRAAIALVEGLEMSGGHLFFIKREREEDGCVEFLAEERKGFQRKLYWVPCRSHPDTVRFSRAEDANKDLVDQLGAQVEQFASS